MALQTMIDKLNKARHEYESTLAELGKAAQKAVGEFLGTLIPPGFALQWKQYTRYYNDGDPCTFSVREPYLVRVGGDDEDDVNMELSACIDRYGEPDRVESGQVNDYSKPRGLDGKQPKKTVTYVERGFPAIEGWSKAKLEDLSRAWDTLPEDLLKNAFGDHVTCRVLADGSVSTAECSHD